MSLLWIFGILAFLVCHAEAQKANANDIIDKIINVVKQKFGHKLDPLLFENATKHFEKKPFFITYKGELALYNAWMTGLMTLHRLGDATLSFEKKTTNVAGRLAAGVLNIAAQGRAKINNVGPSVSITGRVGYAQIDIEIAIDNKKKGQLIRFKVLKLEGLEVKISGLTGFNWMANAFISVAQYFFEAQIKKSIEVKLRERISEKIKDIDFPI